MPAHIAHHRRDPTNWLRAQAETPIDDALFEMPSVKKHGARVVKAVADAVGSLGELDVLAPKLKALGQRHVGYGVLPEHYDVVGEALIATLGDALGTDFTSDVKDAWLAVWGIVRNTMVSDHYDEKSGSSSLFAVAAAAVVAAAGAVYYALLA